MKLKSAELWIANRKIPASQAWRRQNFRSEKHESESNHPRITESWKISSESLICIADHPFPLGHNSEHMDRAIRIVRFLSPPMARASASDAIGNANMDLASVENWQRYSQSLIDIERDGHCMLSSKMRSTARELAYRCSRDHYRKYSF